MDGRIVVRCCCSWRFFMMIGLFQCSLLVAMTSDSSRGSTLVPLPEDEGSITLSLQRSSTADEHSHVFFFLALALRIAADVEDVRKDS